MITVLHILITVLAHYSTVHTYQRVHDALQLVLTRVKHVAMTRETCRDCGYMLTEQNRTMKSVSKKGKQYYLNRCKPCISDADIILRTLKKQNPQPPAGTHCTCCGRKANSFVIMTMPQENFARGFVEIAIVESGFWAIPKLG